MLTPSFAKNVTDLLLGTNVVPFRQDLRAEASGADTREAEAKGAGTKETGANGAGVARAGTKGEAGWMGARSRKN
jgi:ribosomal protein L4